MANKELEHVTAIVLAAGMGKRMKTDRPKVLQKVLGQEMVTYVLRSLEEAGIPRPVVVVGHEGEKVINFVGNRCSYAWQKEQLGTGHAVTCALPQLEEFQGDIIVTCGDTPLISPQSYRKLIDERRYTSSSAIMATMILEDPRTYGRIKRDSSGNVLGIVEYRDATEEERKIKEVNTGTYCFEATALQEAIKKVTNENAQGEYYLTDTIAHLLGAGRQVRALVHHNPNEFSGVNDTSDLVLAESLMSDAIKRQHLTNGVVLEDPVTIRIEPNVKIGARTRIRPGTILEGETEIGEDCTVGPHMVLKNVKLPDNSVCLPNHISAPLPE